MNDHDYSVAIIGMAGRFPGAGDVHTFWNNLTHGVHAIARLTRDQLEASGVPPHVYSRPDYVPYATHLPDAECFDARFFRISDDEAARMDPQIRLALECSWSALEDAGHGRAAGTAIGVYAGASVNMHLAKLVTQPEDGYQQTPLMIAGERDFLSTRVSYALDLRGPSMTVQTACSTSLVAVHMACNALLGGECDVALAGGVTVRTPQGVGYLRTEGSVLSADGLCRPFDARASGTVFSSGVGMVVLKRLADAVAAGDRIWAVVRGTAVNNDGASKVAYFAPSVAGQIDVIRKALANAGVDPRDIGYVEAHGTGTLGGDAVELQALAEVFAGRPGPCLLGSLKGNLGYLDAASGVAGLIKAALIAHHGVVPPSLHFESPPPDAPLARLRVNTALTPLDPASRIVGVSSFGIGGTNAHAIVELAPPRAPRAGRASPPRARLFCLSARSAAALDATTARYRAHLAEAPDPALADVCYTAQVGRATFEHRLALVARSTDELAAALAGSQGDPASKACVGRAGDLRVGFACSGPGAQYGGMARGLLEISATAREIVQRCDDVYRRVLDRSIAHSLADLVSREPVDSEVLADPANAQPALYMIQCGLIELLRRWEIVPSAVVGHGAGALSAAYAAGMISLEDGARLVAQRGRCLAKMAPSLDEFDQLTGEIGFAAPRVPFVSDLLGRVPAPDEPLSGAYWRRHLREPLMFDRAVQALWGSGCDVLVEIGPHPVLAGIAAGSDPVRAPAVLATLRRGMDDASSLLETVAGLYLRGLEPSWERFVEDFPGELQRLPTYAFERVEYPVPRRPAPSR